VSDLPLEPGETFKAADEGMCAVPECPAYRVEGTPYCAAHGSEAARVKHFYDWLCGDENDPEQE